MERTSARNGRARPVKDREVRKGDPKGEQDPTGQQGSQGQKDLKDLKDIVPELVGQFVQLNGQAADRVSGVRRVDDGWSVLVDVVDVERIPATTSVLSTYRVDGDSDGQLTGFERIRRFTRAATDGR